MRAPGGRGQSVPEWTNRQGYHVVPSSFKVTSSGPRSFSNLHASAQVQHQLERHHRQTMPAVTAIRTPPPSASLLVLQRTTSLPQKEITKNNTPKTALVTPSPRAKHATGVTPPQALAQKKGVLAFFAKLCPSQRRKVTPPVQIPPQYRLQDSFRGVLVSGKRVPFTKQMQRTRRQYELQVLDPVREDLDMLPPTSRALAKKQKNAWKIKSKAMSKY